jgi:uncharacterized protein (TIGR03663 family)
MFILGRNGWFSFGAWIAVVAVALALRAPQLERRPLHNDESNQAAKLGTLLDTGVYRYDPHDHHGPTLYYLTLPLARLQSGGSYAATEIWVYRAVPVAFGVLLVLLALGARAALGQGGAWLAALLTAVSPAMVYFSRFYIQEMLLVAFTFGLLLCLWRWLRAPSLAWAAGAGASAGLMFTTKETCVLAWAALAVTAAVRVLQRQRRPLAALRALAAHWRPLAMGAGIAVLISVLLFSSFLTNWRGPLDAVRAYGLVLGRGAATDNPHHNPFLFYLSILTFSRPVPRLIWGEDLILALGLVGALIAWFRPRRLRAEPEAVRLLSIYTVTLTLIYAVIPYKTTWCLLSFWHGWILLAGVGAATLLVWPRRGWQRGFLALLLTAGVAQLGQRAWRAACRYPTDVRNPYVYAQTGMDFMRLVNRVTALSAIVPEARNLRIHVLAPPDQTWPLPWYLRRFTCVGYWTAPSPDALAADPAVIITTPEIESALPDELSRHYVSEYYGLRPEVLLAVRIRADIWEHFLRSRAGPTTPSHSAKEP